MIGGMKELPWRWVLMGCASYKRGETCSGTFALVRLGRLLVPWSQAEVYILNFAQVGTPGYNVLASTGGLKPCAQARGAC